MKTMNDNFGQRLESGGRDLRCLQASNELPPSSAKGTAAPIKLVDSSIGISRALTEEYMESPGSARVRGPHIQCWSLTFDTATLRRCNYLKVALRMFWVSLRAACFSSAIVKKRGSSSCFAPAG